MRFRRRRESEPPEPSVPSGRTDPLGHPAPAARAAVPEGDDPAWLRHCAACGSLAAGGYVFHLPHGPDGLCHRSRGVDCAREQVTIRRAVAVTGMSAEDLFTEVYAAIGDPGNAMRVEAAKRLGMAPPRPPRAVFDEARTASAAEALETAVGGAIPAVPVIDGPRLKAEFRSVSRAWSSKGLWSGTEQEAAGILRVNLERDVLRERFEYFAVDALADDFCAQVSAVYDGVFSGYRIWRTADRLHFCGGGQAILGYGSPGAHGGRAAMWRERGLLPRPHAEAARGKKARTGQLLDELFAIGVSRGFVPGGEVDARTREIGAELDRMGGLRSMLGAHEVVGAELDRTHARHLEFAWDRIGRWLG